MYIFANIYGFLWEHKKWALIVGAIVLLIFSIFVLRSCFKREPKLEQKEITKAQQAIEKEDRKQMIEILTESTVREQSIDNSIKAAEEATEKAKRDYSQLSNAELAAELERRLEK